MPYNWDAPFEIRDIRNGEWFWVQKEVLASKKINASDKLVYSSLAYFANNKTQESFPSYTSICKLVNLHRNTVIKAIKELIKYKFISKKQKSGRSNYYELVKITGSPKNGLVPKENLHPPQIRTYHPPQKRTSNNTYSNKTYLTRRRGAQQEEILIPSKKTNNLTLTRGQVVSFLKSFPTLTTTELKEQIKLCNNYMGMSSDKLNNPGLFLRKWLSRYLRERKLKQIELDREKKQDKRLPDLTQEQRSQNLKRIKEIKERYSTKVM